MPYERVKIPSLHAVLTNCGQLTTHFKTQTQKPLPAYHVQPLPAPY